MSLSGTNTFTQNAAQLIKKAYARIGVLSEANELSAYQMNEGLDLLNMLLKGWIAQGLRLWKISKGTLFIEVGKANYILDGVDANATQSYTQSSLSAAVISGATSISVADATGFVIGYYIGITQDNSTIHWTTISNVVGTTITLTDATTYAATSGNNVFTYQTKIKRPENIITARCQISSTTEIPLQLLSRKTYDAIAIKSMQSISNQLYYNKQRDFGEIYLFPTPSDISYLINLSYQEQFYDISSLTDDLDLLPEWYEAVYLNLAVRLIGFNFVRDADFINNLKQEAIDALALVKGFDDEMTSIYFYPAGDTNTGDYL